MSSQKINQQHDPLQESLDLIKKSQEEFLQHPFWKELQCDPETFFFAVKRHIQNLDVPSTQLKKQIEQAQWNLQTQLREQSAKTTLDYIPTYSSLRV